jgi:hypothetical protein
MPKASAERLAALADDVHFAARLPKHLIMSAMVNVLDRHRDEVEAEARAAAGKARDLGILATFGESRGCKPDAADGPR